MVTYYYLDWTRAVSGRAPASHAKVLVDEGAGEDGGHANDLVADLLKRELYNLARDAKGIRGPTVAMPGIEILREFLSQKGSFVSIGIDEKGLIAIKVNIPSGARSDDDQSRADNMALITAHLMKRALGESINSRNLPFENKTADAVDRYEVVPTDAVPIPLANVEGPSSLETSAESVKALLNDHEKLKGLQIRGDAVDEFSVASGNALAALVSGRLAFRDRLLRAIDVHRGVYQDAKPILRISAHLALSISAIIGIFLGVLLAETCLGPFGPTTEAFWRLSSLFCVILAWVALAIGLSSRFLLPSVPADDRSPKDL